MTESRKLKFELGSANTPLGFRSFVLETEGSTFNEAVGKVVIHSFDRHGDDMGDVHYLEVAQFLEEAVRRIRSEFEEAHAAL